MTPKSLDILTKDIIQLLENNNLLMPLIKAELTEDLLKDVEVTEEELQGIINTFIQKNNFKDSEEFRLFLLDKNINESELIKKASLPIRFNRHAIKSYLHMTEAKFIKSKEELDQITYQIIRLKDYDLCQEIYFRILDKEETFSNLAVKFSEGIEKDSNGVIGPMSPSKAHPVLKEKLLSSEIGTLNQPIKVNEFWVISKLVSIERARLDEQMKMVLAQKILQENIDKEAEELHGKIIKKSHKENVS